MRSGQVPAQKSCGALDATFKNNKAEIDDRVDSNATRFKVEGAGVQEHPDNNIQHNKSKKQTATTAHKLKSQSLKTSLLILRNYIRVLLFCAPSPPMHMILFLFYHCIWPSAVVPSQWLSSLYDNFVATAAVS